ncbi:MAG: cob(I)yrinic acid a,c-diamide adenosyltransferase [Patescibacteria group bacterium]|nr:cob(I)yrinic acid a,c-diamide adenosyltransferase [Patescibacteria group bacterium]MCX7589949.1 cob(I)yrinic acid a,c-diamide adenosyltransferase [Patescibacteria group bacterium]
MIIVFTGDGKGKTTASIGQMIRVIGRGKNALMLQFIKGPWRSGEDEFSDIFNFFKLNNLKLKYKKNKLKKLGKFKIIKGGLGFVGILGDKLPFKKHKLAALKTFELFKKELNKNKWDLIVLDEINVALNLKLLKLKDIISTIKNFPKEKILILSGRGAPKQLIKLADLVTETKSIKHPFDKGILAKVIVEF